MLICQVSKNELEWRGRWFCTVKNRSRGIAVDAIVAVERKVEGGDYFEGLIERGIDDEDEDIISGRIGNGVETSNDKVLR